MGNLDFDFEIRISDFPIKRKIQKTDIDEPKSFSKMDFKQGPLIEIHLGKGFWFVEIRFWISHPKLIKSSQSLPIVNFTLQRNKNHLTQRQSF